MKCRVCKGPAVIDVRRHNAGVLPRLLRPPLRRAGAPGDRRAPTCSSRASGCSSRCRAARTRSPCGTSCVRLGYDADGLYLGLGIGEYSDESGALRARVRRAARAAAARGRPRARRTASTSRRRRAATRRAPCSRVRAVEAAPLQLGRARARLRRRRDRPQPRRRSRGAARQRAALGDRLPRPPAPGAARGARLRAQGEAAGAARRARDRGVLRAAAASTTSSRSARWPRATGTSGTRRCSTRSRTARPASKAAFLFGFLERGHERFAADADDERDELRPCPVCGVAHAGRRLRVLPPPGPGGASSSPRRAVDRRGGPLTWPRRSRPATGCCSSTPSGAATSSRSRPAGEFHTHAGIARARRRDRPARRHHRAHHAAARASSRCARRSPSTCSRCRAARR